MIKKSSVRFCLLSLLLYICALSGLSSAQVVANKQQIISQARHGYYDLTKEGLSEFECSIVPNWDALLADTRKTAPERADNAVKILSQIHFTAKFGRDGKVQLTHNSVTPENAQQADAFSKVFTSMEQMTSGIFDIWKLFMLNPPFPSVDSQYQLEARGPEYRLSYKEGDVDIVTTMSRDFVITDRKETAPDFDRTIQPKLTKTPKGFLFTAYDDSYQTKNPEETTLSKVLFDYQEVDGLQIIQKVNLSGSRGGSPIAVELAFSDCKVTKRTAGRN